MPSSNTYCLTWVSLTLDKGYLLTAAPPDLERGVAPLGPPVPSAVFSICPDHGPDIPGSYAVLLFTSSDLASITSHIHNWVLFLLWLHPFILSGVISPLITDLGSSSSVSYHTAPWWLRRSRRAERSYSKFKVRRSCREEIPLVQDKEQQWCLAGAAMKRYPTSKVRETQERQ